MENNRKPKIGKTLLWIGLGLVLLMGIVYIF